MSKAMPKTLHLPPPHAVYHHYQLADGSRIYPSGRVYHPETKMCRWFVWCCTGVVDVEEWDAKGKYRVMRSQPEGHILLNGRSLRYFDTPQQVLVYLQELTR